MIGGSGSEHAKIDTVLLLVVKVYISGVIHFLVRRYSFGLVCILLCHNEFLKFTVPSQTTMIGAQQDNPVYWTELMRFVRRMWRA